MAKWSTRSRWARLRRIGPPSINHLLQRWPTSLLSLLALISVAMGACDSAPSPSARGTPPATLASRSHVDTLRMEGDAIVVDPVVITTDNDGRYVILDRSEGNVKVYEPTGELRSVMGGPGAGPGQFTTLLGGGIVRDSIVAYDFMTTRVSVYDKGGIFARSMDVGGPGNILPLSMRAVDDTLLLLIGVPAGNRQRDLLRLIDPRGVERARLFNRQEYFTADAGDLIQQSMVIAAGGHGIIAAGVLGGDSLWVFDYDGREIAAGPIRLAGDRIPSARELRTKNGHRMRTKDGGSVLAWQPVLTSMAVLDANTVLLQIMRYDFGKVPRLDRTQGGHYLLVHVDRRHRLITIAAEQDRLGGLLGQTSQGEALVLRYLDEEYRTVEIARITTLATAPMQVDQ